MRRACACRFDSQGAMKAIIQLLCGEGDVIERGRVPGGPIITIDEPEDSDVLPPVRVEMRFLPPTGSTIDLDTLRVSGALSMSLPV